MLKRVQQKNAHVQLLALSLLDLLVKNCHTAFHQHLGTRDNLKLLSDMAVDTKVHPNVRSMILTLLESWSETFTQPRQFQIPIFAEYYYKLKNRGVEFPARDMTKMAPVMTPPPSAAGASAGAGSPYYPPTQNGALYPAAQAQFHAGGGPQFMPPAGQPGYYGNQYPPQQQQYYPVPPLQQNIPVAQPYHMHQQPNQSPPQHLIQQQQQQPPLNHGQSSSRPRAAPSHMSDAQTKLYQQCTYLSAEFIHKLKKETKVSFEYIVLLCDLSSAAESSQELRADPLASNLQRLLIELRNRYTKLILELGDIVSPQSAVAAEFLIDLSIRMIENIRIVLDFHKLRIDSVACQPPEVILPRSLNESSSKSLAAGVSNSPNMQGVGAQQQQAGSTSSSSAQSSSSAATMNIFDLPMPSQEDDEKALAASVFAQARSKPSSSGASPAKSHQPTSTVQQPSLLDQLYGNSAPSSSIVGESSSSLAMSSPPPRERHYESPPGFSSHDSFKPSSNFTGVTDRILTNYLPPNEPGQVGGNEMSGESEMSIAEAIAADAARAAQLVAQQEAMASSNAANQHSTQSLSSQSSLAPPQAPPAHPQSTPFDDSDDDDDDDISSDEDDSDDSDEQAGAPPRASLQSTPAKSESSSSHPPSNEKRGSVKQSSADVSDSFDLLAPMRAGERAALRKTSFIQAPEAAPSSSSVMSPGGPEHSHESGKVSSEVSDAFLDDMMNFTIKQKTEEGKQ